MKDEQKSGRPPYYRRWEQTKKTEATLVEEFATDSKACLETQSVTALKINSIDKGIVFLPESAAELNTLIQFTD